MAGDSVITNISTINATLARMDKEMRGKVLKTAVMAGLLPIQAESKIAVHKVSGTLARSIHSEAKSDGAKASGRVGTDVEYAMAEEFRPGGGHAYMRPAYDAEKETAVKEVSFVIKKLVQDSA